MALTRKYLKALEIDDAKIDQIIEAHTETTDALKADRDKYREEAESIAELQKQFDDMKRERDKLQVKLDSDESYKAKYEAEQKAFEEYKAGVEAKQEKSKKAEAYKALLKEAGISDKRFDAIVKVTDIDSLELDDDGKIKGSDDVLETIKTEWAEFVVTETTKGASTENPPSNNYGDKKMTVEEIDAIEDTAERQRVMAENHELYGI